MQKIILVRHAQALNREKAKARGIPDKNRPLTEAGLKKFKKHINVHKNKIGKVELFATSPFVRSIDTLDAILDVLDVTEAPIKIIAQLTPHDRPEALIKWLKKRTEKTILIVSHEPFISNFLYVIAEKSQVPEKIKKGSLIVLNYKKKINKFTMIRFINP